MATVRDVTAPDVRLERRDEDLEHVERQRLRVAADRFAHGLVDDRADDDRPMQLDGEVDAAYPARWIGKVSVTTSDVKVLDGRVDEPKGEIYGGLVAGPASAQSDRSHLDRRRPGRRRRGRAPERQRGRLEGLRRRGTIERALELNPDSASSLNYLGYMLADRGVKLVSSITSTASGLIRTAIS